MMKTLTEYDYEPGESVDYVTLIIYYQSLSQKMTAEVFYCDCAQTSIRIIFSVYATSVV